MIFNCPGNQKFKQPSPEIIKCASCGADAEIWTDENKATCPNCKNVIIRKYAQSCLDWCKCAKVCAGVGIVKK